MRLAEELGLPLVTVIDTPGAELSLEAEEGAIAGEIARCIADPDHHDGADRLGDPRPGLRRRRAGAAAGPGRGRHRERLALPAAARGRQRDLHGDTSHAAEMAERHRVRAADLAEAGIVHEVVPELPEDTPRRLAIAVAAAWAATSTTRSPPNYDATRCAFLSAEVRVLVRRTVRCCGSSRAFWCAEPSVVAGRAVRSGAPNRPWLRVEPCVLVSGGRDLRDQGLDAGPDLVADRPYGVDALAGGVVELPVLVALAREDRARVAAAHRDHDVGRPRPRRR